jgi:Ulp1 protease family, C-terminal catalytic domain
MESDRKFKGLMVSLNATNKSGAKSQTVIPHSSAFKRITSSNNLKIKLLPDFLKSQEIKSKSNNATPTNKDHLPSYKDIDSILKYISSFAHPARVLLKVGKIDLKKDDLDCLISRNLSKNIIDAVLSVIKHLNSKLSKENSRTTKILIAKTNFTQKFFNNEKVNMKIHIIDNTSLLFPIFVGHWTLLYLNCNKLLVHYYDPINNNQYLKEILKSLYKFLARQIQLDGKNITDTRFKELSYQRVVINEHFSQENSEIYMLKQAYNIVMDEKNPVRLEEFNEYRRLFLKLLFQYGTIN